MFRVRPRLNILSINDLPLYIAHSDIDIFADDATLRNSSNDIHNIHNGLQIYVDNVVQ